MKAFVIEVEKSEPRLLDLAGAAAYLSISRSADLVNGGHLLRVKLPSIGLSPGRLDRFLVDKADLDAMVERSKELVEKIS
jgi:hypothetical protein